MAATRSLQHPLRLRGRWKDQGPERQGLDNHVGRRVAVAVNNVSEINIEASTVQNEVQLNRSEEKLVEMKEYLDSTQAHREESFGHMRQELVFVGQNLDRDQLIRAFDDCLLSEEEVLAKCAYWQGLHDLFPAWENQA